MNKINKENINDYQVNGVFSIMGSMKADNTSKEVKKFKLNVKFDNVLVSDIIEKALDPTKIQWVNGVGRKHFDTYKDGQAIEVDFKSPGRAPQLTMIEQLHIEAKAAGVDIGDKAALKAFINEKLGL